MRCRSSVAAVLLLFSTVAFAAPPTPKEAIRSGDIAAVQQAVIGLYEAAEVTWNPWIEWKVGPFTTTYWYYDSNSMEILVGDLPKRGEVDAYWQAWSTTLTDGNFDPASFFASPDEAAELAAYNQFVLTTHEAGHAMTYRYDYGHLERHDYAINCREYYADRLTVAILDDLARDDADMARWRQRYQQLVVAMGETIPAEYRVHIPSFAALDADCALIDLAQPTPQTMQPYAAAFFERYRLLLEARLPSFAEVAATHLLAPHRAELEANALLPERAGLVVETIGTVTTELGDFDPGIVGDDSGSRRAAFAPDGTLYFANLTYQRESGIISLAFGTDPDTAPLVGEPGPWERASMNVELTGLAVGGADRFWFCLDHWERDADDTERQFVTVVDARRSDGQWVLNVISEDEGVGQCTVHRSEGGRLFLLMTPEPLSGRASAEWVRIEVNPDTYDLVEAEQVAATITAPDAVDDEGRLYLAPGYDLWRVDADGSAGILIGNGLRGPRDGGPDEAQFTEVGALQWTGEGALLLDEVPGDDALAIRRVHAAP